MSAPDQEQLTLEPGVSTAPTVHITEEQDAAIAARDRDVFLEAGAGTGKTRVLVQRFCAAVDEDGVDPDRMLAFTFTEKAAGELKQRVRGELMRRGRIAEARAVEGAWLSTIHAFCRRLLATHPLEAGLDPSFRVLDADEADRLTERAFERALEELLADPDPERARLAAAFGLPRLRRMTADAHDELRSRGLDTSLPEEPPASAEDTDIEAYRCVRELLELYSRRYAELKRERSGLDFQDLELEALRLLRESQVVREEWQTRFRHVLVDEFQDTSPVQADVIRELQGSETRLFMVGDELQSIYGFRRASLDAFREERDRAQGAGGAEPMRLRGNFRALPEILGCVNAIGEALLDGFEPLQAGREDAPPDGGAPAVELLVTEERGWKELREELKAQDGAGAQEYRVAEARLLARRLRQLADADGGPSPGSMVVLLRASTHVRAYEEALERAGLNPYVVGGRGYWSHQQVEDPLRLLAVIANPLDDEALFGALSSPASAASADSLWILRQLSKRREPIWPALQRHFGAEPAQDLREEEQRWTAAMPKADEERLRRFVHRIELLRAEAPRLGLEELTERVTSAFDYDLATLLRPGGARRMANLRKLMRLAREFEEDEGRDLRGFLTHAETRAGREDRESEAATEAEGHDGVRLMTIHNAKGLEFDVVAVADLGRDLLSGSRASAIQLGEPRITGEGEGEDALRVGVKVARLGQDNLPLYDYGELAEERKLRDEGEELRLAYVAATRARERLILSGWGKLDKLDPAAPVTPRSSIIARLLPALGVRAEEGETVHVPPPPALPGVEPREAEVQIPVTVSYPTAKAARELSQRREELAPPSAEVAGPTPPIAPLDPPPEPLASRLSYSALAQYERCPYRFYVERGLGLGRREETASANGDGDEAVPARELRYGVGSAVHELLEWSARNAWTRPDDDRARGALARAGIEPDAEHVAHAAAMVDRWLTSDLCRGLQGDGTAARAEVPFLLPLCGTILRGSIDLLSGPRDGEALVVDYKTDSLEDRDPAEAMTEYERQRDLYALAAAAAGAKRVRTAYFFCDEPGTALEMTYDAAELEAARGRLGELIARVAAGDFEPTPQPHRRLCAGCPAQERLCSWDKSMTMRDAPE